MIRSIFPSLATLLMACAASTAPAPKPQPFVSGWEKPTDHDKDCTINRENGILTIGMPGSDHDYDPRRGKFNSPHLLLEHEIESDFIMQIRVRIDSRPSVQSTVDGQPSAVSAGFLVLLPQNAPLVCIRMDFDESRMTSGVEGYIDLRRWRRDKRQGGKIIECAKSSERGSKGDVYLRLERQDGDLCDYVSSDGENWKGLGLIGGIFGKLKVGLVACSSSTEPSKVRFDQLKLWRGKKKVR